MGRQHDSDGSEGDIYERRDRPRQQESFLKGWSASGKLLVGVPNPAAIDVETENSLEAVNLAVNFTRPNTYTLQFSTNALQKPNPTQTVRTLAEIIWSVSGNSVRRLISVLNGTSISGSGEGVTAKVFDWSGSSAVARTSYNVGVLLSPGIRGSTSQPPTLEMARDFVRGNGVLVNINAGTDVDFLIPVNAGVNSVFFSVTTGGFVPILPENVKFVQEAPFGQGQKAGDLSGVGFKWWPISAGASKINVDNNTAQSIQVAATWGVEG